jgi:hypothetical protein
MAVLDVATIERDATLLEPGEQARYLRDHVGQEVAAYVCGLRNAQTIGEWIRDPGRQPRDTALMRLGNAYICVRLMTEAFGDKTAKMWLFGHNSRLGGVAPAYRLRHARSLDDMQDVVPVAKAFAIGAS